MKTVWVMSGGEEWLLLGRESSDCALPNSYPLEERGAEGAWPTYNTELPWRTSLKKRQILEGEFNRTTLSHVTVLEIVFHQTG